MKRKLSALLQILISNRSQKKRSKELGNAAAVELQTLGAERIFFMKICTKLKLYHRRSCECKKLPFHESRNFCNSAEHRS